LRASELRKLRVSGRGGTIIEQSSYTDAAASDVLSISEPWISHRNSGGVIARSCMAQTDKLRARYQSKYRWLHMYFSVFLHRAVAYRADVRVASVTISMIFSYCLRRRRNWGCAGTEMQGHLLFRKFLQLLKNRRNLCFSVAVSPPQVGHTGHATDRWRKVCRGRQAG